MLTFINELPTGKKIAGVHTIPITEGNIMMAWDEDEQILTTIGGRVEENESLEEALAREVMEESGITLHEEKIPFACWYWDSTNTYTVRYLSRVDQFVSNTFTLEKTGYVISNFETMKQMVRKMEGPSSIRTQLLIEAEKRANQLNCV
ncbi:NUDIX hydrolase [Fictibacillus sp. NPDC058756]|uniref:NUDIX hydrolase n=1 Tax=Fictibacillus sp. NPDC058756 TaxID=3346625 RepID=UPI003693B92B